MYTILIFVTKQAVLIIGVSLFQECSYFRGVLIPGVLIEMCPCVRGVIIEESGALYLRGILIKRFHYICTYYTV